MTWQMMILAVIAGYICGSIPFSKIVSAVFFHRKLPQEVKVDVPESDDIYHVTSSGAAAASMTLGARAGCTIGVFDMLKVAVPTLAFKLIYPEDSHFLLAALGGMIGHNWPVFNRFKGGRGISS
ncbi:MAG: glycerol-3-phosphate acyltransferase, partial [Dehalococcoidales bacterium]|nr:glycerol-3-phosphate acyltransferase [Dehalococcoidales bacterium]